MDKKKVKYSAAELALQEFVSSGEWVFLHPQTLAPYPHRDFKMPRCEYHMTGEEWERSEMNKEIALQLLKDLNASNDHIKFSE